MPLPRPKQDQKSVTPEPAEVTEFRALLASRKAIRARADGAAQTSYKLLQEADGYTDKINALLDAYLDGKEAA